MIAIDIKIVGYWIISKDALCALTDAPSSGLCIPSQGQFFPVFCNDMLASIFNAEMQALRESHVVHHVLEPIFQDYATRRLLTHDQYNA